jgi:uncharacterized protein YbjT (DUF2867 family)
MRVLLYGATGMLGQGVLRECLLDPGVEHVLAVGRHATGQRHEKLRELVREDLFDLAPLEAELAGHDACFFCLGVSSAGMGEAEYTRITFDLTLAIARALARLSPAMTFIYVSGAGTDSTEQGLSMWARVKGRTENELLRLPFKAFMFRPGLIRPLHGIRSRTPLYRAVYATLWPFYPLLQLSPGAMTTTEKVGRAMLEVASHGATKRVLDTRDINQLAAATAHS